MPSLIERVWRQLALVDSLSATARSEADEATGWEGEAEGQVDVATVSATCMLFNETGTWTLPDGKRIHFKNTYRWTLVGQRMRLEHLRLGPDRPIYLFDLVPESDRRLASATPHICSEDQYSATLACHGHEAIELKWSAVGPRKNETIAYRYRTSPRHF